MAKRTSEEYEDALEEAYNDQSIRSLKGADRVRLRPAVIFGSDGIEGCEHSVFEIVSNSVDEARAGHGKLIRVTAFLDGSVEVEDEGRGIPLGWNEKEGRYNWDLIFCELYAGGKYDNNKAGANYEFSLGLNGLGACATQYSSEYMEVYSYDGKSRRHVSFLKGNVASELEERPIERGEKKRGTVVRWKPDREVFTDINIPADFYRLTLKRQAVVNNGITFLLRFETEAGKFEEETFLYEDGLPGYLEELCGGKPQTSPYAWRLDTVGKDRDDKDEYKVRADFCFCVSNTDPKIEYYHNSSFLENGGSPDKAVRTAFVSAVDKYLRAQGKYNKNEDKILYADIADCLVLVINSFSTETSYENQTKKAITNTFIYTAMCDSIKENLEIFFAENPIDANAFADQVLINRRSRENAEATRVHIKAKLTENIDISNRVEKFVACRSKDPNVRELYIVEGDSALSSCKLGRNAEFQAIIPVRGKTLNCLKAGYDRIFKSEIITDLLRVIGCGVEISGKIKGNIPQFNLDSLRWSKIILCTDADEDGFQIRTLLLTLFYRLLPTLLQEQRIFIAETPLFEITTKNETLFAYNEFERADILRDLDEKKVKYSLQRSKGLGENDPEMMWQTTMSPATRRLVAVTPADAGETAKIFDILLGDNLAGRKDFIATHGSQYMKVADI